MSASRGHIIFLHDTMQIPPAENGFRFCCYCGREMTEAEASEETK